jgi:two-component system OmpR family response regulator
MQTKSVLLVEDEKILRENIAEFLEAKGYEVVQCQNGNEALGQLLERDFDIIVSDIVMSDLTGTQLLEKIRTMKVNKEAPFIFISAKTDPKDIRESMNIGADDYLPKPFLFHDLERSIQKRLERFNEVKSTSRSEDGMYSKVNELSPAEVNALSLLNTLTKTQKIVFEKISKGISSNEIAEQLDISVRTVLNHRHNIAKKLQLQGTYSTMRLGLKLKSNTIS